MSYVDRTYIQIIGLTLDEDGTQLKSLVVLYSLEEEKVCFRGLLFVACWPLQPQWSVRKLRSEYSGNSIPQ